MYLKFYEGSPTRYLQINSSETFFSFPFSMVLNILTGSESALAEVVDISVPLPSFLCPLLQVQLQFLWTVQKMFLLFLFFLLIFIVQFQKPVSLCVPLQEK